MEYLLRLMGIWVDKAERIVSIRLDHHGDAYVLGFLPMTVAVFLGAVGFTALSFWLYKRSAPSLSAGRRYVLAGLRAAFLVLLLVMLLRPVLSVTVEGSVRQTLLLLVDTSSSMQIKDVRADEADVKRAAIAKGLMEPDAGLKGALKNRAGVNTPARVEVVKAALTNQDLTLLERLEEQYNLAVYTFDREVADVSLGKKAEGEEGKAGHADYTAWAGTLEARGQATALGDAVRDAIYRKRGQQLAGALVVTDGASNSGGLPVDAARVAREEKVPLYFWGVGITSPRDIAVTGVVASEVAFVRDEVPVTVTVRSQGLKGQRAAVVLTYGGKKVDEQAVDLGEGVQQVAMKFVPEEVQNGAPLVARIEARPDEVMKDNNESMPHNLRVIDGRIKVLHVEQSPRWEYKYIQALLMRDRRVEYKTLLFEADASMAEGPDSPYIKAFPSMKELGDNYDVVILGDVDPEKLGIPAMERLSDFVSRLSGSVIVTAGKKFTPLAYRRTPIEKMLPVEFEPTTVAPVTAPVFDKPLKLELTEQGRESPLLRMADKEEESVKKWGELPAIYWTARVLRPKPAAEVLVVDGDVAKASRFGKMPVIALQQYGRGKVLYIGTDNTWRWRKNTGEEQHRQMWSRLVDHMAVAHQLGGQKRTQLAMDRQQYEAGQRVVVLAHLYRQQDYAPVTAPALKARFGRTDGTGAHREVTLKALPDQPGAYRAEFVAPGAGTYRLKVDMDPDAPLDFAVTEPMLEAGETALNEGLLKELAEKTGGAYFREEDLHRVPGAIRSTAQPVYSVHEVEFWSSPLYFLLLLGVVTVEWILRKVVQLK